MQIINPLSPTPIQVTQNSQPATAMQRANELSFGAILGSSKLYNLSKASSPSEPYDNWANNFRFNFPVNYPSDLKLNLENMWQNCQTNKERDTFESMYYGQFLQVKLPNDDFMWSDNWRETLKSILKNEASSSIFSKSTYNNDNTSVLRMTDQLLENSTLC